MIPYQFICRTFQQPSNFTIPVVSNDSFPDPQLNNLYYVFLTTFSQQLYSSYTAPLKQGCRACISNNTKYLLMSAYVLRNWYNPNNSFNITLSLAGGFNMNVYLVINTGSTNTSIPLVVNANGSNAVTLLTAVQAQLPLNCIATLNPAQTILTITYIEAPFPSLNWVYVVQTSVPSWYYSPIFNPYIPTVNAEAIIENCIQICGSPNFMSESSLFNDKNFVPLPLPGFNINDSIVTYISPVNIYFN